MKRKITIYFEEDSASYEQSEQFTFEVENRCPHCGIQMRPEITDELCELQYGESGIVPIVAQCVNEECSKYFLLQFLLNFNFDTYLPPVLITDTYDPPIDSNLPDKIVSEFPKFKKIYDQSTKALNFHLDEIAGIGYRKALEFLISEYLIWKNPNNEDIVNSPTTSLSKKITMIDDEKLAKYAKASSWIGNDETHFSRQNEDKTVTDLISFIGLVTNEIERDILRLEAEQLINPTTPENH